MRTSRAVASCELKNYQVPIPSSDENKAALRRKCRTLIAPESEASTRAIHLHLKKLFSAHPEWKCVATFFPLSGEPDLTILHQLLPDRLWVYPRVDALEMTFHPISDPAEDLAIGRWNLHEPKAASRLVQREEIDVMLCPGVAFDVMGRRLGKGKGFYDRYLSGACGSRPYRIGVTFASYLFDNIPAEQHDVLMNCIITEQGPISIG
ncbi:MAG: hypothetical protein RI957_1645 [Verrucomicrobiota bacterium]|jgi:5-formyltetrahydrofolate cyclo-ligase